MEELLKEELERLKRENLYRKRFIPEGLKIFCSNNYLNLAKNPEVIEAVKETVQIYGVGSGASQLVSGYTQLHQRVEQKLSEVKRIPQCITVGSGYLANLSVLTALVGRGDIILSDRLNHASIVDGVRLSKAEKFVYPHKDTVAVERFLKENRKRFKRCLIVTDGVFSMDGDLAPLRELSKIAETYNCFLVVDDAHATGTIGYSSLHYWGLEWQPHIVEVGTFSKALGSYGAYICASETVIEYLTNFARPIIFSTSLPPPALAGALKGLEILQKQPEVVGKLQNLSKEFKRELKNLGWDLGITEDITPIVPLMVYDERRALEIRDRLLEEGIFIQAIRYPTVEKGKARLRLTVTLEHSEEDYERLLKVLRKIKRRI